MRYQTILKIVSQKIREDGRIFLYRNLVRDRENQPTVLRSLGVVDPHLIATIAEEAPKALKWLKTFGIKFDFYRFIFSTNPLPEWGR